MEYTEVLKNVPLHRINKEFTQKDFIRETMVKISANKSTPVDILSSEFSNVTESEVEYVIATANVNVDYTCMVGTDRMEEYWDKEKYTEDGITKYRDVKKTRKVTDWSPFIGKNSSREILIVENNEANPTKVHLSASAINACNKTSLEDCGIIDVGTQALPRLQAEGEYKCFHRATLPGDHQKDENYSGTVAVSTAQVIKFPFYSAKYTYNGREYTTASCASGELSCRCDYPDTSDDVRKQAKKKARPFLIASPISFVLAIVFSVLNITALYIILFIATFGLLATYFIMAKVFMDKMINKKTEEKKNRLIRKLISEGMQELSTDELALFNK